MRAVHQSPRLLVSCRAANVTKLFGGTVALWNIDVEARSGGLLAIHGTNGSGKTTLLRILAGMTTATRGHVSWTTDRAGAIPRVALLGHWTHLFDELTAIENVSIAARLARRDATVGLDLLGRLGVGSVAARPVAELSAGTRRRVGLARALATDPDVLLVDEPFAGLDTSAADLVARALARSRDDGRLTVIATHDDTRSRSITTNSLWLDGGRRLGAAPAEAAAT